MTDVPYAFPHPSGYQGGEGMTLRDWFAGQAITGLFTEYGWGVDQSVFESVAAGAFRFADVMMAERAKGEA